MTAAVLDRVEGRNPRPSPRPAVTRRRPKQPRRGLVGVAAPLALFVLAATSLRVTAMSNFGLIDIFPVTYYLGLALTALLFLREIFNPLPRRPLLVAHTAVLLVFLETITPLTYEIPRYAWTYKHIGVVRLILERHAIVRGADIYNNWSGLFGLAAAFSRLSGIRPEAFAAWAEPFFGGLSALAVGYFARSFFDDERVVFGAVWIFVATCWVGQMYFAPQPLAFILSLLIVSLATRHLCGGRPLLGARRRIVSPETLPAVTDMGWLLRGPSAALDIFNRYRVFLMIVVLYLAVSSTHQLTPFIVIGAIAVLIIVGGLRPVFLPVLMFSVTQGWFYTARDFMKLFPSLTGSHGVAANATSALNLEFESHQSHLVALSARTLSVAVWGLAALGALVALKRRRIDLRLPLLMMLPFPMLVVSDYGGEAIYRVFLFSAPPAATLIAYLIFVGPPSILRKGFVTAICLGLLSLFVVAYFGREQTNRSDPAELDLYRHVTETMPRGSVIVFLTRSSPSRFTANYGDYISGPIDLVLLDIPGVSFSTLDPDGARELSKAVLNYPGRRVFLIASDAQKASIETYGTIGARQYDDLVATFRQSGVYRTVYTNSVGEVLEFVPEASPT